MNPAVVDVSSFQRSSFHFRVTIARGTYRNLQRRNCPAVRAGRISIEYRVGASITSQIVKCNKQVNSKKRCCIQRIKIHRMKISENKHSDIRWIYQLTISTEQTNFQLTQNLQIRRGRTCESIESIASELSRELRRKQERNRSNVLGVKGLRANPGKDAAAAKSPLTCK